MPAVPKPEPKEKKVYKGLKRTPLKRGSSTLNSRTYIKRKSKKREAEQEVYLDKRIKYLRSNPHCQVLLEDCTIMATQVHHKARRVGENYTNEKTFLAICDNCHRYLENNPVFAKENNYLIS